MRGKLIKTDVNYLLQDDRGVVIASTSLKKEGLKISLKKCQEIEYGYDLDRLALHSVNFSDYENESEYKIALSNYKKGFQKALELMKDFSLTLDPKLIDSMCLRYRHDFGLIDDETVKKSLRITMTQLWEEVVGIGFYEGQTEWNVDIEMECPQCQEWGYISECRNECNKKFLQPKLDAYGCLILKRV